MPGQRIPRTGSQQSETLSEPNNLSAGLTGHASLPGDLERFCSAWRRHTALVVSDDCKRIFLETHRLYEGDHRYYHGPRHIHHCLERLDEARLRDNQIAGREKLGEQQLSLIELAIWFHDVIYTAGSVDNESLSADWFEDQARDILNPDAVARIYSLITATAHKSLPSGDLEKLMVDIDLSSFALPREAFLEDGSNIRQEFNALSDSDFVEGQSAFLRKLLDRPSIYSTDWYRRHCEAAARKNIEDLLDMYERGFKPKLLS